LAPAQIFALLLLRDFRETGAKNLGGLDKIFYFVKIITNLWKNKKSSIIKEADKFSGIFQSWKIAS